MPKQLIIHGGIHKTGTTSLQVVLWKVRKQLLEQGVLYPESNQPGIVLAHHALAKAFANPGAEADRIVSAFRDQCDTSASTVIVSSEAFSALDADGAARAIGLFRTLFETVRVVFYLRPQVLILRSQYSQQIREGYITLSFDEFYAKAKKEARFWKFRDLCERWLALLQEGEFSVRSALQPDLLGHDVVQDFFATFVQAPDLELPRIKRRNDSLTQGKVHAIRQILLEHDVAAIPFEERRLLLRDFINEFDWSLLESDAELAISTDMLDYCNQRFANDNAYLSRFLGGRDVFGDWYRDELRRRNGAPETRLPSVENLATVARAASDAWAARKITPSSERPRFVTATHYFGRCSMGNFWSTFESGRVRQDLEQILADGFNTVIFIVPWAHLQPRIDPIEYDDSILERLAHLLAVARAVGLRIILRLGYLWENARVNIPTYRRYQELFAYPRMLSAWTAYLEKIEALVGVDADDCDFLLSWEDAYWPVLRHPDNQNLEGRINHARDIGFTSYIAGRLSLDLLRKIYGVELDSYDRLAAPTISEKFFAEFALFFDRQFVEPWLLATRSALVHDIWYEHRIDPDVASGEDWQDSVEHGSYKAGASCDVIYYHPKIGVTGAEPLNARLAVDLLERVLTGFRRFNIHKRPVFLDQFNFKVNNPKHPDFWRLADEHIPAFLERVAPVFKRHLTGYGIWGYRDWRDDRVFNGAFELGLHGWEGEGIALHPQARGNSVGLVPGSELRQTGLPAMPLVHVEFVPSPVDAVVDIWNGTRVEHLKLRAQATTLEAAFEQTQGRSSLRIVCVSGSLQIAKVAYYSHVFTNGMRDIDGRPNEIVDAVAALNRRLARS